jgi:DNA repair photolyase
MLAIREVTAKSILNKSKIFDYCVNPYTGCQFACRYCYARLFMTRYSGHKEPWGEFVDAKVNAPNRLRKQLIRAKEGGVWVSSVTDPYQPLEKKLKLTRECLRALLEKQFPVTVQTKSDLVLRDLDLLQNFKDAEVGFTITTDDERIAALFEPNAPPVRRRIAALERLYSKGIATFAFIGPILPGNPERLVAELDGKVKNILIDRMNYLNSIRWLYKQHNLEYGTTPQFFREHRNRLAAELKTRRMNFRAVF